MWSWCSKPKFMEASSWFGNTEQKEAAHTAETMAVYFWQQSHSMLGEDPAVDKAHWRAKKA